jgi:hypothetical protein
LLSWHKVGASMNTRISFAFTDFYIPSLNIAIVVSHGDFDAGVSVELRGRLIHGKILTPQDCLREIYGVCKEILFPCQCSFKFTSHMCRKRASNKRTALTHLLTPVSPCPHDSNVLIIYRSLFRRYLRSCDICVPYGGGYEDICFLGYLRRQLLNLLIWFSSSFIIDSPYFNSF